MDTARIIPRRGVSGDEPAGNSELLTTISLVAALVAFFIVLTTYGKPDNHRFNSVFNSLQSNLKVISIQGGSKNTPITDVKIGAERWVPAAKRIFKLVPEIQFSHGGSELEARFSKAVLISGLNQQPAGLPLAALFDLVKRENLKLSITINPSQLPNLSESSFPELEQNATVLTDLAILVRRFGIRSDQFHGEALLQGAEVEDLVIAKLSQGAEK